MTEKKRRPIYFDPGANGTAVFMGPSEAKLMDLAWAKESLTVKKALFFWEGKPRPAYTTVMTLLSRLWRKGLLKRKKEGRSFVYAPSLSKKEFFKDRLELVSTCLKNNLPDLNKL